jgi:hypothetical protein
MPINESTGTLDCINKPHKQISIFLLGGIINRILRIRGMGIIIAVPVRYGCQPKQQLCIMTQNTNTEADE